MWYLEFGSEATIESLHGVAPGSRWLGTFDRAEAVAKESIDFYASGHPLVEGILDELADGPRGRVAFVRLPGAGFEDVGVVAIMRQGTRFSRHAWTLDGAPRPDWIPLVFETRRKLIDVPGPLWDVPDWGSRVGQLFADQMDTLHKKMDDFHLLLAFLAASFALILFLRAMAKRSNRTRENPPPGA